MIKAMFFDVDRTIFSHTTYSVSPAVVDALHALRGQGIKLFLSTGRHPAMLKPLHDLFSFDGYVTMNGQLAYCEDAVLHQVTLPAQEVKELATAVKQNALTALFLEQDDFYTNRVTEEVRLFMDTLRLPVPDVYSPDRALEHPLFQSVVFVDQDHEHLLLDGSSHLKITRWNPFFVDVMPPAGGKDQGVDAILNHFGFTPNEAMAFGDGENDIPMLTHVGIGVAMGNASDAVKACANYVTTSVEEDGVVRALEHFGFLPDFVHK